MNIPVGNSREKKISPLFLCESFSQYEYFKPKLKY